jgi:prepilin-type N-terminal cleavage/methylation domain-containing protein
MKKDYVMLKKDGYTLAEILVVLLIIATLVALAWPNYMKIKEKTLNREAKASLALIRAAEKIYRMEQGFYYPRPVGTTSVTSDINSYLKLSLPTTVSWTIGVNSNPVEKATATRSGVNADGRVWSINLAGDTDPTCSGGTACP